LKHIFAINRNQGLHLILSMSKSQAVLFKIYFNLVSQFISFLQSSLNYISFYYIYIRRLPVLSNELKSIHTYKNVNNSKMEIFDSHDSFNNKHGIKVEEDFKNLPSFHLLPKVHKKPDKVRYFVNSRSCSTKE